jgi:hypothetical protein
VAIPSKPSHGQPSEERHSALIVLAPTRSRKTTQRPNLNQYDRFIDNSKKEFQTLLSGELPLRRSGACAHRRIKLYLKNASLLERLSVSKFPFRHPVLYGLFLELRSFAHRIRSLVKRGGTRPLEIGSVYQQPMDVTAS